MVQQRAAAGKNNLQILQLRRTIEAASLSTEHEANTSLRSVLRRNPKLRRRGKMGPCNPASYKELARPSSYHQFFSLSVASSVVCCTQNNSTQLPAILPKRHSLE
ncbi:hypothetical protein ABZP36_004767 [Zizania latifolia]